MTVKKTFAIYVIGQIVAYGLDIGSFYLGMALTRFEYPLLCNIFGKLCAAAFAFFFHARFTFVGEKATSRSHSAGSYVVVLAINMAVTSMILKGLLVTVDLSVVLLKFFADIVAVFLTFTLMNRFVFPRAEQA